MAVIRKVEAEAATKLRAVERVKWLRLGRHVFRRVGRRWMPALTAGQIARARAQLAYWRDRVEHAT